MEPLSSRRNCGLVIEAHARRSRLGAFRPARWMERVVTSCAECPVIKHWEGRWPAVPSAAETTDILVVVVEFGEDGASV